MLLTSIYTYQKLETTRLVSNTLLQKNFLSGWTWWYFMMLSIFLLRPRSSHSVWEFWSLSPWWYIYPSLHQQSRQSLCLLLSGRRDLLCTCPQDSTTEKSPATKDKSILASDVIQKSNETIWSISYPEKITLEVDRRVHMTSEGVKDWLLA